MTRCRGLDAVASTKLRAGLPTALWLPGDAAAGNAREKLEAAEEEDEAVEEEDCGSACGLLRVVRRLAWSCFICFGPTLLYATSTCRCWRSDGS